MTSLARATGISAAAFVAAAIFDYGYVAAMSWMLTPAQYGVLSVATTYFLLLSFFVASGFPMSVAKFLSESQASPRGLVRFAMLGNLAVAALVVSLFLVLTWRGPLSPGPREQGVVVAVAAAVMLLAAGSTLQFALQGRMRFQSFAMLHASKSINKLLLGAGLVLLGFGVAGALGGLVFGGAFLIVASAWALRRAGDEGRESEDLDPATRRRFLRYTLAVFAGSFALTLLMSLDMLAVKYLTPAAGSDLAAASYQAATILTKAPLWAILASMSVLFPLVSRAAQRSGDEATRLVRQSMRWTVLVLAPASFLLLLFPERALALVFPAHYQGAAATLAASSPGMAALALCLVLTRALQATDRARSPGVFLVLSVLVQVGLLVILVPREGPVGAAWATTIACVVGALFAFLASVKPFGLRPRVRDVAALAASLAVPAGIVWAMEPFARGRLGILASLGLALAAYAVAIAATGLLTRAEIRALLRRVPLARRLAETEAEA